PSSNISKTRDSVSSGRIVAGKTFSSIYRGWWKARRPTWCRAPRSCTKSAWTERARRPPPACAFRPPKALPDLVIRGRQVYTPNGPQPASIHISGGVIESVQAYDQSDGDAV